MIITILPPGLSLGTTQWQVWASLVPGDPLSQHESFIIGLGDTRDEAITAALTELDDAVDVLCLHNKWTAHQDRV